MNNPVFYAESNNICKDDCFDYIQKHKNLIKWQENENILDVGSGDASVTLETLLPEIPKSFKKLVGIDISPEMVDFARKRTNNSKIDFRELSISSNKIPEEFKEHFHHIFSFYCLQWVSDQRQAFKNMYKMLKPGGQILITLVAHSPPYDAFVDLQKNEKYEPYMNDFEKTLFPYQWSTKDESFVSNLLGQEGFNVEFCKLEEKVYPFSMPDFDKFILSLNPYLKKISQEDKKAFAEDYTTLVKNHEKIKISSDNDGRVNVVYNYKVLIAFGSKRV